MEHQPPMQKNDPEKQILISCIICFHNEGYLAHTTLLSMDKVRKYAEDRGFLTELIVVLDKIDELTERIVTEHPCLRKTDTVIHTQFGNPADSRTEAVKHCNGSIVGIFDGDDYFSENYLYECAAVVNNNKNIIAHPDCVLSFGEHNVIYFLPKEENYTKYDFVKEHPLILNFVADINIVKKHPYVSYRTGFVHEDWAWNAETISAGYKHYPVPKTMLFYRRKKNNSVLKQGVENHGIIGSNPLFDQLEIPLLDDIVNKKITKSRELPEQIPEWIEKERLNIAKIDVNLHPKVQAPITMYTFHGNPLLGQLFAFLYAPYKGIKFDFVYVVPWIVSGGGDLMIINFANQMSRDGFKVCVISTLPVQSAWRDKLNSQITYIDFGNLVTALTKEDKILLLIRLLLQMKIRHLHNINSSLCHEVIALYGGKLSSVMKIYASLFCDDQIAIEYPYGFISCYARTIEKYCQYFETDNTRTPVSAANYYGIRKEKFKIVYGKQKLETFEKRNGNDVLWCGRITEQKRPDLLLELAKVLPKNTFHVYGRENIIGDKSIMHALYKQSNIILHGEYNGFHSIPLDNVGCLLYTSGWDGLPNVLLEAASRSLPIVASNVGGISDFINDKTGWLMPEDAAPQDYADAIEYILSHPEEAKRRVLNAQELLKTRHSEEAFRNSLYELYDLDPTKHRQSTLNSEQQQFDNLQKLYEMLPMEKLQRIYCDIITYSMQKPAPQKKHTQAAKPLQNENDPSKIAISKYCIPYYSILFNYYRYKLLSKFTSGKTRKHYFEKRQELKKIRNILRDKLHRK